MSTKDNNIDKAFRKIIKNSRYGEFHATKSYFELFDKNLATKITKTGKKLVRKANGKINKQIKTKKK